MIRKIGYNWQVNNITENNLNAFSQCFSTSIWMMLSYYCPSEYQADDDQGLSKYVLYCEEQKVNYPHPSLLWVIQQKAMQKYLDDAEFEGKVIYRDGDWPIADLYDTVDKTPVIIGTKKLGRLPDGHIILLADVWGIESFDVKDPYGNANTNYEKNGPLDGDDVIYTLDFLRPHIDTGTGKCRIIYIEQ